MKHVERVGERSVYRVVVGTLGEKDHLEDLSLDGRIVSEWFLAGIVLKDVEWIDLAWDRDKWIAFVKEVMSLRIP